MALVQTQCIGCLQPPDDHPKHQIGAADGTAVNWHMDCHATTGCMSCTEQSAGAEHLTGDAFRDLVIGLGDEFHQNLMERVNEWHQLDAGVHPSQQPEGE